MFKLFRLSLLFEAFFFILEEIVNYINEIYISLCKRFMFYYRLVFKGEEYQFYGMRKAKADFARIQRQNKRRYKKAIARSAYVNVWVI